MRWILAWIGALCLLLAAAAPPARAQEGEFTVERVEFRLSDMDGREYQLASGEAVLSARLLGVDQNAELEGYETVSAENLTYPVGGDGLPFQIEGDTARVAFVVFQDPARNPLRYELNLRVHGSGEPRSVALDPSLYVAGPTAEDEARATSVGLTSDERAPQKWEYAALAGIGLTGLVFAWLVLGRVLFRKMLFGGRMAVGTALTLSNLMLLGALILLVVVVVLAWLFPMVHADLPYQGYILAAGSYLLLLALAWGLGSLAFNR